MQKKEKTDEAIKKIQYYETDICNQYKKNPHETIRRSSGGEIYLRKSKSFCCNFVSVSSSMLTYVSNSGNLTAYNEWNSIWS